MLSEIRPGIEKFAISGSASVGKSTMTDIYRKKTQENKHVRVLEEGAQVFFQIHPELKEKSIHTTEVQQEIQDFVLTREQEAYQPEVKLIICDRSVIDPIIYTGFYQGNEYAKALLKNVSWWLPTYTKFLILDPKDVPNDAGHFRRETPQDRVAIHKAFIQFCRENNLSFEVISGSLDERIDTVDTIIDKVVSDEKVFKRSHKNQLHDKD